MAPTNVMLATFALYALPVVHYLTIKLYYGSLPREHRFMSYPTMFFTLSALGLGITIVLATTVIEPAEMVAFTEAYAESYAETSDPTFNQTEIMDTTTVPEESSRISEQSSSAFLYIISHLMIFSLIYYSWRAA